MSAPRFDLPNPDHETQQYWDAARDRRLLVKRCRTCGRAHFYPSESLAWERLSGVFFLPPTGPMPTAPSGWLRSGWPAGAYEFRIDGTDGSMSSLPFVLEGGAGTPLP